MTQAERKFPQLIIIDDDKVHTHALANQFKLSGLPEPEIYHDQKTAVAAIGLLPSDSCPIILVDRDLTDGPYGGFEGLQLAIDIQKILPNARVLGHASHAEEFNQIGFDAFLKRKRPELINTLKAILDSKLSRCPCHYVKMLT